MTNRGRSLKKFAQGLWQYLHDVSGQSDYTRYRARALKEGTKPLTPREFYEQRQKQKYSSPNRCC